MNLAIGVPPIVDSCSWTGLGSRGDDAPASVIGASADRRRSLAFADGPPVAVGTGRDGPCYTPALTATTGRSSDGTAPERARDGASRAGTDGVKVAREP